eukprot:CAMPEP_0196660906 /NCGR_PEP_ID=MMETSP1086-20130531/41799_1 /TAXON_ID=77921 /ORGANISM="Cyanoptyche  gloeocystis , Strain SAG4.97" /LENGTH=101 /DNA_ID=CAMNT_0041995547 /DNA_START=164 /DNA_END=466 /DNA_ORIENTATION=-
MSSTKEFVIAYVTVPNQEEAQNIATKVLENKLAACVNAMPVTSSFWWEGKIDRAEEKLLMIKTRKSLVPELTQLIKAIHPYDVPEVICVDIVHGNTDYLNW